MLSWYRGCAPQGADYGQDTDNRICHSECETRNPHNSRFSRAGHHRALRRRLPQVRSRWRLARKQAGLLSALRPIAVYMVQPSFEAVSRTSVLQTSQTLDHIGIFARHLVDIARLGDVVMIDNAGLEAAITTALQPARIFYG